MAEIEKIMKFKKQLAESDTHDIYTQISRLGAQKYHDRPSSDTKKGPQYQWAPYQNAKPQPVLSPEEIAAKTRKGRSNAPPGKGDGNGSEFGIVKVPG
jgi:hypothetical protein